MEAAFVRKNYEQGVVSGIEAVTRHLIKHFPADGSAGNELPNATVVS